MHTNRSATELSRVLLEPNGYGGTYIWLRRNIRTIEITEDGLSQTMWEADEVNGLLPYTITQEEADTLFDVIWEQLETSNIDIATLVSRVNEGNDAIADLSGVVSAIAEDIAIACDAIAELSEMVVGGE